LLYYLVTYLTYIFSYT